MRATAASLDASPPSPYTVSVGNATSPPRARISTARATGSGDKGLRASRSGRQPRVLHGVGLRAAEILQALRELLVGERQHGDREQAGVGGARVADGEGRDRDALR